MLKLSGFVLAAALSSSALAAEEKGREATCYTDPEHADEDFALQGEFSGWQWPTGSDRSSERIGLQVVAQGDRRFFAIKYLGGLPGDGWQGGQRIRLEGRRVGSRLLLEGDVTEIRGAAEAAHVLDRNGKAIGELKRVTRISPTLNAPAPQGAVALFDGHGVDQFKGGRVTDRGWLMPGAETKQVWKDFRLHGEFYLPYKPYATGQERGNSGFYLQKRYEVQVLDSFGLEGVENEAGSLYKQRRPDVNMCLPPLTWQTYDIDFTAARFDESGKKIEPAVISVWHNGTPIHNRVEIAGKTGNGQPEATDPLPILLQDHQNPVVYRNLWIIDTSEPAARSIDWLRLPPRVDPQPIDVERTRTFAF
jgi:hypothetical protein